MFKDSRCQRIHNIRMSDLTFELKKFAQKSRAENKTNK